MIYLDNNSTTVPDQNMINAVMEEVINYYGNPSSTHYYGQIAKNVLDINRASVAQILGTKPNQIIFTSGGTESNYIALYDKTVICSAIEHSSVLGWSDEANRCRVKTDGLLDLEHLEQLLKKHDDTPSLCVSIMYANNETGIILDPFFDVLKLKQKYGFIYHIDAVQAIGKGVTIDVNQLGADFLTISAHKIHGLKGAGALYIRNNKLIQPVFIGGNHEFGRRPGTENQIGIASLGYMCNKINNDSFYKNRIVSIKKLRDDFELNMADIAIVNGNKEHRVVNTSSLSVDSITDLELFLEILSSLGVFVSGKSACSSGMAMPSKTLVAMFGENDARLNNTLRVSLSVNTTATDLEIASNLIREARLSFLKEIGE